MSFLDVTSYQLLFLLGATFFAGFVDSIVGGGGLINVPALFSVFPQATPANLFATNKLAGIAGTASSALRYARRINVEWNAALPAALSALIFAFLGSWCIAQVSAEGLRKALPFLLAAVAFYTFKQKQLGLNHAPVLRGNKEKIAAAAGGAVIGFYDGFFGPGTGSFLVFMFVRWFGFNFLSASAAAKIVNVACNFASLSYFIPAGYVWWQIGLAMAVLNILGAQVGAHLALKFGAQFVRRFFLLVVLALIGKTFHDGFFGA